MSRTSSQIRQDFLDFFKSKQHTIVPSSSLMPDSPNLLFTNAGMNQFVPIFLGQTKCPYTPGRAADTQKCIRAGGKHNDLDDVGLDTYHHTFFEMLGNWSFGDYFKKDAITWAWELVIEVWKFPPQRVYATIYQPDKSKNDPADRDQEAWDLWAEKFRSVGLDPEIHIVNGNKKDNFWMMGETGPCGPCTEVHVDLRPGPRETDLDTQKSGRTLVNSSDARCIEIWNNVFIQYNANPDGTFSPLPAQHVDTGMGFERVTSIIQGTKGLTDFVNAKISNYETDIFRPIFDELEKMSGKKYCSTLPGQSHTAACATGPLKTSGEAPGGIIEVESGQPQPAKEAPKSDDQIAIDIAFRVIADHIRTLSFSIADGIQPGIKGRNGVLRGIHKRMLRYASTIGIKDELLLRTQDTLVDTLSDKMGDVFPELRREKEHIKKVLRQEADVFTRTLETGLQFFNDYAVKAITNNLTVTGEQAFKLYDTYGFPLDLTELMARERGLTVDKDGFQKLMDEQKKRSQDARVTQVVSLSEIQTTTPTKFVGYDNLETGAKVLEVVSLKDRTAVILDSSTCYAEMGGQVGDTGELTGSGQLWHISNTQKSGNTWLHIIGDAGISEEGVNRKSQIVNSSDIPTVGSTVTLSVDKYRRHAIERHHTVTHLLHWALHEVASEEASQKGSAVGPDKLTFDFNSAPLTAQQVADIEKLVNERILDNAGVSWTEVPHAEVKNRKDVMQFFGDKYGDVVRVVQIGGQAAKLDGYSMELCGGTHTRATGEIGLFRIVAESAVAAGVRRIEAVAGLEAYRKANDELQLIKSIAGKINSPIGELEKKIDAMVAQQKDLEKQLKAAQQKDAANAAKSLVTRAAAINGIPALIENLGSADGDTLQTIADSLKSQFKGVIVLGGVSNGAVTLIAAVSPDFTAKVQAGKIIQTIAPIVGGKGGGKPDNARGGGKDATKLDEALAKAKSLLG